MLKVVMRSLGFINGNIFMFAGVIWFLNNEVNILLLEFFLEDYFDIFVDVVPNLLAKVIAI